MYCHRCWNELIPDSMNARRVDQRLPYEDEEEEGGYDPQREQLYAAELDVEAFRPYPQHTIAELQEFVNEVFDDPWTRDHFGTRLLADPIMVWPQLEGLDYAVAWAESSTIWVPEDMRNKFTIVHEVCHILVNRCYGRVIESHGKQFATFFALLVGQFLGADDWWDLLEAFDRNDVNYEYLGEWLAA
jgi:hypothetical protein